MSLSLPGGRSEKGVKEKGAAACVPTQFPCLLIYVLYTDKDGTPSQPALLHQDSLQATGAYSQVRLFVFYVHSYGRPCVVIMKQNWCQFLLVVKATALKRQISNFYPPIQHTDASDHSIG